MWPPFSNSQLCSSNPKHMETSQNLEAFLDNFDNHCPVGDAEMPRCWKSEDVFPFRTSLAPWSHWVDGSLRYDMGPMTIPLGRPVDNKQICTIYKYWSSLYGFIWQIWLLYFLGVLVSSYFRSRCLCWIPRCNSTHERLVVSCPIHN